MRDDYINYYADKEELRRLVHHYKKQRDEQRKQLASIHNTPADKARLARANKELNARVKFLDEQISILVGENNRLQDEAVEANDNARNWAIKHNDLKESIPIDYKMNREADKLTISGLRARCDKLEERLGHSAYDVDLVIQDTNKQLVKMVKELQGKLKKSEAAKEHNADLATRRFKILRVLADCVEKEFHGS